MLEIYNDIFMFRGAERLLIVVGGVFFAYLGYRLFIFGVSEGNGKLETESAFFKLTFSGSGPGLFFMAFGALVLINSVFSGVSVERDAQLASKYMSSDAGATTALTSKLKDKVHFSGAGAAACDKIAAQLHGDNPDDILWAYANSLGKTGLAETGPAIAAAVESSVTDPLVRLELLKALEERLCHSGA